MSRFKKVLSYFMENVCWPCIFCMALVTPLSIACLEYQKTISALQADIWELQIELAHLHDQECNEVHEHRFEHVSRRES